MLFEGQWQSYRRNDIDAISVLKFFDVQNCLDEEKVPKTADILSFPYQTYTSGRKRDKTVRLIDQSYINNFVPRERDRRG